MYVFIKCTSGLHYCIILNFRILHLLFTPYSIHGVCIYIPGSFLLILCVYGDVGGGDEPIYGLLEVR